MISPRFDRTTARRFIALAKPFFVSEVRWQAISLLLLLATFSISISWINVRMSYIGRDFMTALTLKEKDDFITNLYYYLFAFAGATVVVVFYRYTEERLALIWRRWLSLSLLNNYFAKRAYYQIGSYQGIDNPDQRIVEDVRTLSGTSLSLLLIVFNSLIALYAFARILWSISIYLGIAAFLYAIFGSFATYILGRPLIGLNFAQLKKDADYRYKLINVRDHAESIAFMRGERKENTRVRQRLKIALDNMLDIINWNRNLNFFTTGYNYLVTILPTVIVAPLYLKGEIEFGVVTQAGFAFGQVLGALSIIVLNFGSLSTFAAVISRLGSFSEAITQAHNQTELPPTADSIEIITSPKLSFENFTLLTPRHDQVVIKDLNLSVQNSLLITGASGCGKSSLMRAIAGFWRSGHGIIRRPDFEQCIFLPQRAYMVIGTFRSQFLYPRPIRGLTDRRLLQVLEQVRLLNTLERVGGLDAEHDWSNMLSSGEQQRIAFARMLLQGPRYVFLDEATTALDVSSEIEMYEILKSSTELLVSVGYRTTLERFHQQVLEISGAGHWKALDLTKSHES